MTLEQTIILLRKQMDLNFQIHVWNFRSFSLYVYATISMESFEKKCAIWSSVTRFGDLLDFGLLFKFFGNN